MLMRESAVEGTRHRAVAAAAESVAEVAALQEAVEACLDQAVPLSRQARGNHRMCGDDEHAPSDAAEVQKVEEAITAAVAAGSMVLPTTKELQQLACGRGCHASYGDINNLRKR
eukprot:395055-Prymnesium_polylepis.1